ncbi:MAG: thiol-disulfide oxidoreductase DCC family protein [Bacteroidota bacterium]
MKTIIKPATYPHPILLYDGVCTFCNTTAQFIIKHDTDGIIHYAALQSEVGQQLLDHFQLSKNLDTVILVDRTKVYQKSDVAVQIGKRLGGAYRIITLLQLIPRFIRDHVYDYIARHRYRWFGKKQNCNIPSLEVRHRFLDL